MWMIEFCDIKTITNADGSLRIPTESDWEPTSLKFKDKETAHVNRINLYKNGDGYYRVRRIKK